MTRTDRLTGIILALRGGRQTASQLAGRFEVSRRTILRDVDALGQIGVPVVAAAGVGGGYELAAGYWLPPLHLSAAETAVLLLALRGLGGQADSPLGEARRTMDEKLRGALRPDVLAEAERDLATVAVAPPRAAPTPAHLRLLRDAVRRDGWVRVDYQSLRRVATHLLLPVGFRIDEGRWYCDAVSLAAAEVRRYRLDRVLSVEPVPSPLGAEAARVTAALPRRPYDDPAHPEVVVRLSERGLRLAEDALGWSARAVRTGPEAWEIRFRCPPGELAYYARAVHAVGPTAEVVAPPSLRALVRELATATAAIYDDPVNGDETVSPTAG